MGLCAVCAWRARGGGGGAVVCSAFNEESHLLRRVLLLRYTPSPIIPPVTSLLLVICYVIDYQNFLCELSKNNLIHDLNTILYTHISVNSWSSRWWFQGGYWLSWVTDVTTLQSDWTGLLFLCRRYFFPHLFYSSYFLPLFHCLISILPFPCAGVWENTRAWVPHFL